MNRVLFLIGIIALAGIFSGCEKEPEEEKPLYSSSEPAQPASPQTPRAYPVTQETRDTYQFYCTQCHGVDGHGKGINAPYLTVPPRDHTKAAYLETRTDEHLFTAIQQGGLAVGRAPCMPSWQHTLDDDTIHSLVSYIRELCECEAL